MVNSHRKRTRILQSKISPESALSALRGAQRCPPSVAAVADCPAPDRGPSSLGPESAPSASPRDEFAETLREARLRSEAGDPIPQTPVTAEMMDDPVHGEFWRRMF